MVKPRNPGRRPKATRRGDAFPDFAIGRAWAILTDTERDAIEANVWFCLVCRSNKERWVVDGLRRIGMAASFTPLVESPRRASKKSTAKDFEGRNISRMPGLVFAGVGIDHAPGLAHAALTGRVVDVQGNEQVIAILQDARRRPLVRGYIADGQGRPVTMARHVITRMMALSKIPLYTDAEGAPTKYRPMTAGDVLEPGDECEVVGSLLRGETGRVARIEGHEAVMQIGSRAVRMPAKWLRRQAGA